MNSEEVKKLFQQLSEQERQALIQELTGISKPQLSMIYCLFSHKFFKVIWYFRIEGDYRVRCVMVATVNYSIDQIKQEARYLVERGIIDRQNTICFLCEFIPPKEWVCAEYELEKNDYLLRDHICDLLARDEWKED